MRRSRFSDEQIIGILQERQAGLGAAALRRRRGVSDATFCKWRSRFGGMEVWDAMSQAGLSPVGACRTGAAPPGR